MDKILSSRLYYKKLQYKIAWEGHDPDPEWYPAENFKHSPDKLQEYHQANPEAPGSPVQLEHWITAALGDRDAEDHPDNNYPAASTAANSGLKRRRNA
jgi:hypothetical protein